MRLEWIYQFGVKNLFFGSAGPPNRDYVIDLAYIVLVLPI
jgi:hypothetical protein